MADPLLSLIPHPLPVLPDILSQPLCSLPSIQPPLLTCLWVYRRQPGKLWRNFNHCLVDQNSHRIQIRGPCLKPQPLRLKRYRPTTGKRIMKCREFLRVEELCRIRMVPV